MSNLRYSICSAANEDNLIAEVEAAMRLPDVVGIVDEHEGGIVAYASANHASKIVDDLNSRKTEV